MIDGEAMERAERMLQITYTNAEDMPRQLTGLEVDHDAFATWMGHRKGSAMRHYADAHRAMDPRLEAAFNTLLMHFFLVGIVAGRNETLDF
jgi:hypothetical protein